MMKCENCNAEMIFKRDGYTAIWECPNCGYNLASTYFDEIDLDKNVYKLTIESIEKPTIQEIKAISKLISQNFAYTKAHLESGETVLTGKANLIKQYKEQLEQANINFEITPDFPY